MLGIDIRITMDMGVYFDPMIFFIFGYCSHISQNVPSLRKMFFVIRSYLLLNRNIGNN